MRSSVFLLLAAVFALAAATIARGESDDERYLAGLRERRLFRVAETYCEAELAKPTLDDVRRAELTIENMLTLSQHAVYSPPQERDRYWRAARLLAARFPDTHPRKAIIDLQAALVALSQGELARQEAEANNAAADEYAPAQALLREATAALEALEKKLTQLIAQRRGAPGAGELTADELFALQQNARYQLARARRNQALCYPPQSNDRVAALGQAVEQLTKLRTQLADDEPLAHRVKIDQGAALRLMGNDIEATHVLSSLLDDSVPLATRQLARAELARVALDTRRASEALRFLTAARPAAGSNSAELEFALLETYVALWKTATQETDAARYRQDAVDQLAMIEKRFGVYWARRGEWLVIGSASGDEGNLEILIRTADARFVKGQFDDETLKIYDEAAKLALLSGDLPKYLELAFRAAAVQQRRDDLKNAAERALELGRNLATRLSAGDPLQAKAALIHLQGIRWWREAQALAADAAPAGAELVAHYTEQLKLWPTQSTAAVAQVELAAAFEAAGDPAAALDLYRQVPQQDKLFPTALAGAIRTWPADVERWKQTFPTARDGYPAKDLVAYFRMAIAPPDEPLPLQFSDTDRTAALGGARLLLQLTTDGYSAAEELLRGALLGSPHESAPWKQSAQALLVVALAGQSSQRGEAVQIVAQLGEDSPAQLLEMLGGLTELAHASSPEVKAELAALQLSALERLRPQRAKLEAAQQVALARIEAEALVAAGRRDEALAAYEKLAQEQPHSAAVQQGFAELLSAGQDRATMERALAQWRVVAQGSRPQTERWFRAKYEVAHLNYRLGDKAQAAQLIKYLEVTPPGLDATPLKRQFLELLQQCEP
jgi:hypothetical protein